MNLPSLVRSLALASVPLPRLPDNSRTKCGHRAGGETGAYEQGLRTKRPRGRSRQPGGDVAITGIIGSRAGVDTKNPRGVAGVDIGWRKVPPGFY